jgi:hypothetical protein
MGKFKFSNLFSGGNKPKKDSLKQMKSVINVNKEDDDETIRQINDDVDYLIDLIPTDEEFLGKIKIYPSKVKWSFLIRLISLNFLKFKKLPDLTEIRNQVSKPLADQKEVDVSNTRFKIKKLLKKCDVPKVHALSAIQLFNDINQSGLGDTKKFQALKESLIEISKVLYSGDKSLFHVTLFLKIYVKYLDSLGEKVNKKYKDISMHTNESVINSAGRLHRKYLQLTALLQFKGKINGIVDLSSRLKGTSFITEEITKEELSEATLAVFKEDTKTKMRSGKTGYEIMLIELSINLLLSNIPIFKKMIKKNLNQIPNNSRDFILQKAMVRVVSEVVDFQLAMSSGDRVNAKRIANKIYSNAIDTINEHLEYAILTKPYEVDPFIKAAWIAKESKGLIIDEDLEAKLKEAVTLLRVLEGERCQVKGATQRSFDLKQGIEDVIIEKGWEIYL